MKIVDSISTLSNGATTHHCAKNISLEEKKVTFDLSFEKFETLKQENEQTMSETM